MSWRGGYSHGNTPSPNLSPINGGEEQRRSACPPCVLSRAENQASHVRQMCASQAPRKLTNLLINNNIKAQNPQIRSQNLKKMPNHKTKPQIHPFADSGRSYECIRMYASACECMNALAPQGRQSYVKHPGGENSNAFCYLAHRHCAATLY